MARLESQGMGTKGFSRWEYARTQFGVILNYLRLGGLA